MAVPITPIRVGDVVKLKKPHPCGTNEWQVVRVGMDVVLECRGCGRKVRLLRYDFDRRFRGFLSGSGQGDDVRDDDAQEKDSREGGAPQDRGRGDE